jgi:molecular chaperone DnaJ
VDLAEALNIFMRDFGGLGGFEAIFGGGRQQTEARRGQDIRVTVKLSLQEVATGAKRTVKLKTMLPCEACGGSGAAKGSHPVPCATCGATGEVRRATRSMFGQFVSVVPCPSCQGEGVVIQNPCEICRGDGRNRGERSVPVDIPAGVSSNNYITLRGQGAAGPRNGPNGDLLIMLEVKEDDRFERQGDDLFYDLPLSFSKAALGVTVAVPTPYGEERLPVPAGVQAGTVLRIRGKGLPRLGGGGAGDLNVRVHIWTPQSLTPEQKALFEALSKVEGDPPKEGGGLWSRIKEALGA